MITIPRCLPTREMLLQEVAPGSVGAEIGVYRGDFAQVALNAGADTVYLVDPWAPATGNFVHDLWATHDHEANGRHVRDRYQAEIASGRVRIVQRDSLTAHRELLSVGAVLDWVYIDACHAYEDCLADLRAWSKLVRRDGAILGHDLVDDGNRKLEFGVRSAVETFVNESRWRLHTVTCDWPPSYMLKQQ